MSTCRICDELAPPRDLVKYSVRHYAHFDCYLTAGKSLHDLHTWQIRLFPYRILKAHGLLAEAKRRTSYAG